METFVIVANQMMMRGVPDLVDHAGGQQEDAEGVVADAMAVVHGWNCMGSRRGAAVEHRKMDDPSLHAVVRCVGGGSKVVFDAEQRAQGC